MNRPRRRCGLAIALAAALLSAGCAETPSPSPGSPVRHPLLRDVRTFALGLGVDPSVPDDQLRLGAHDLVVIDGDGATPEVVDALHADGAVVVAYLSVGTFEPFRAWFAEARAKGLLLDRWEQWDEWYAAVDRPATRALLEREARRLLDRGVDGLFLDNVDLVETHPDQAEGMATLVAALDDLVGDRRVLLAQNGDPIAQGVIAHLDGWNREDVSFTFDADADGYVPVAPEDRALRSSASVACRPQGCW